MTRLLRSDGLRRSGGLVLIEVMIAMVLLGLLLVPLVSGVQSIAGSADRIRNRGIGSSGSTYNSSAFEAWEWGEEVSDAWWRPGPILHVQARSGGDEDRVVGLWHDGWFLGEWESDEGGVLQVDARVWAGLTSSDLTVRVRQAAGAWGPPWRLVIPSTSSESVSSESASDGGVGETVVHVPAWGNPGLRLSWADVAPDVTAPGLLLICPSPAPGTHDIQLDGRQQSWKTEASRDLDIYF
jgi:hypothetical protein